MRNQLSEFERKIGQQTLEIDFLKRVLQRRIERFGDHKRTNVKECKRTNAHQYRRFLLPLPRLRLAQYLFFTCVHL